jgi:hypothetical protein
MLKLEDFTTGATAAAIGALGTASFAIVDGLKTLPVVGVSNAGYTFIQRGVQEFFPDQTRRKSQGTLKVLFDTLHGNWINGRELEDQKAIAKSLIKLLLGPDTAGQFAKATGVNANGLLTVGTKMSNNTAFDDSDANVLGRFDLSLSAILDDAYQHADQRYRNWAKLAATFVAVLLSFLGGLTDASTNHTPFIGSADMGLALLVGIFAAPLAPVTKDLASALQAGVKVAQGFRS